MICAFQKRRNCQLAYVTLMCIKYYGCLNERIDDKRSIQQLTSGSNFSNKFLQVSLSSSIPTKRVCQYLKSKVLAQLNTLGKVQQPDL